MKEVNEILKDQMSLLNPTHSTMDVFTSSVIMLTIIIVIWWLFTRGG